MMVEDVKINFAKCLILLLKTYRLQANQSGDRIQSSLQRQVFVFIFCRYSNTEVDSCDIRISGHSGHLPR